MERALVTGGCGFLGSHLVQQLSTICKSTHYLDVKEPRNDLAPADESAVFHKCSLADADALEDVFKEARPDTVFHLASMIDCRPRPSPLFHAINVGGTASIIALCQRYGVRQLVYTSSFEVMFGAQGVSSSCNECPEDVPYPKITSQDYQRTKIAAERLVLEANNGAGDCLRTVSLRPAHIFGPGDDLFFMASVPACFGAGWLPSVGTTHGAKMSLVYVENMAAAHILAVSKLVKDAPDVAGCAFNITDFDQNVVAAYHDALGVGGPWFTLPFWFLYLIVRCAVAAAVVFHDVFGVQILRPKNGMHEAVLCAGLPATIDGRRARTVLGYRPLVARDAGNKQCQKWVAAGIRAGERVEVTPLLSGREFLG